MSSYAYVDYDDLKEIEHTVSINDITYATELVFPTEHRDFSGDLFVSNALHDGSIKAEVIFPFNRDRDLRNGLVEWFMNHGLMFRVVH